MPNPTRSTITIDSESASQSITFDALACEVTLRTRQDMAGMPEAGTLFTTICVWVDFHDFRSALPFDGLQLLFNSANIVTHEKFVDVDIKFWRDESRDDTLCSFNFKGWISRFTVSNPMPGSDLAGSFGAETPLNHLLYLEFEPEINESHFKEINLSN